MNNNNDINDLLEIAKKKHQEEKLDEAQSLYQDIIAKDPHCAEAFHLLGIIATQKNQFETAVKWLDKAIVIDPTKPHYHNNLANVYNRLGDGEKAQANYLKAIELDSKYVDAYNNLAAMYYKERKLDEAIYLYHKLLSIKPAHIQAHYNLGLVFIRKREFDFAIKQFKNVLSMNPGSVEALHQIANLYLLQEKLEKALKYYDRLLELDPEHLETLNNIGVILIRQDKEQAALDYFTRVLAIDEEHFDARNNVAALFLKNNLYENAIRHYKKVIKLKPDFLEAHYNIAVAYMSVGHLDESIERYEYVLKSDPAHTSSLINLGAVYMRLGKNKKAIKYFQKGLELAPDNITVKYMLSALTKKQEFDLAPSDYVKSVFNNYALYFDKHMHETLHYQVPKELYDLFTEEESSDNKQDVLDLGCGTGLSGEVFRSLSSRLVGIDLAKEMLSEAKKKKIYDELIEKDILKYLKEQRNRFNLIVASDVLEYFGDLTDLLSLVRQALKEKGYFLFSTEISEKNDYLLQENARFAHSIDYIKELSKRHSWHLVSYKTIDARTQNKHSVKSNIYLLQNV